MPTRSEYELARFLVATWAISCRGRRLPVGDLWFDRALERVQPLLPSGLRDRLVFVDTSVGRHCANLPEIVVAALDSCLVHAASHGGSLEVGIPFNMGMDILDALDISFEHGRAFGEAFDVALMEERQKVFERRAA